MAETSVIRSFLVSLGFVADQAALKKFEDGIEKATKGVFALAAAVEATAATIAIGVAKYASNLEALYFSSQRTNSSVTALKALDLAAQNFGASAGEAVSAVEGLSKYIRDTPAAYATLDFWLSKVGKSTHDANGKLHSTVEIVGYLGELFKQQKGQNLQWLSSRLAGQFGMSDNMMLAIRNGDFANFFAKMNQELAKSGFDKTAKDAHSFWEQIRELEPTLDRFANQVVDALQNKFKFSLEGIKAWFDANGDRLAKRIADILSTVIDWAEKIVRGIKAVIDKFQEWDAETNGWSTKLLGLIVVMKLLGGFEIISGILSLAAAFLRLGAAIEVAATGGVLGSLVTKAGGLLGVGAGIALRGAGVAGAGITLGWLFDKLFPNNILAKGGSALGGALFEHGDRYGAAMRDMTSLGWSHEQAAAWIANFNAESGLNPGATGDNGLGYGIGQWHPDRQAKFKEFSGKDIHGSTMQEQMAFASYEARHGSEWQTGALLMAAKNNAALSADIISRHDLRPADAEGEARRRSADAVNLSMATTIHVNGTADAKETAKHVTDAQERVASAALRNILGAMAY